MTPARDGRILAILAGLRKGDAAGDLEDGGFEVAAFWEGEAFGVVDGLGDPVQETNVFASAASGNVEHVAEVFWSDAAGAGARDQDAVFFEGFKTRRV